MAEEIGSALALLGSVAVALGIATFLSLWVHRAEGNRALTMGLYIVFGAFSFFLFLFGLGSLFRNSAEGNPSGPRVYVPLIVGAFGGLVMLPPTRRLLARVVPFDARSWPDTIGLLLLGSIVGLSIFGLFAAGEVRVTSVDVGSIAERAGIQVDDQIVAVNEVDVETISELEDEISGHAGQSIELVIERDDEQQTLEIELPGSMASEDLDLGMDLEDSSQGAVGYFELVLTAVSYVLLAFILVGARFHRTIGQARGRLGLFVPTYRQVGVALGLVIAAFIVAGVSGYLVEVLQPDLASEIEENLRELTSEVDSVWGAVVLGVSAGVGEEILFRGAIQPRYGVVFTALVFAVLHQQYGASVITAGVFFAGILFGLERKYLNTTCCIITHALYNTLAVLATQLPDPAEESAIRGIHHLIVSWPFS